MKTLTKLNIKDIIVWSIFIAFCSLLLRGTFYSALFYGINYTVVLFALFTKKVKQERIKTFDILIMTIPFTIVVLGLFKSDNIFNGFEFVFRSLPLMLLPLFYSLIDYKLIKKGYDLVIKFFPFFVLVVYSSYVLVGFYLISKGYGEYLQYINFAKILDLHPTYAGFIVNIGIFFYLRSTINKNLYYYIPLILFIILLIIIASKTSLFLAFSIITFNFLKNRNTKYRLIVLCFLGIIFMISTKILLETRFADKKLNADEELRIEQSISHLLKNDIKPRLLLWKSNINSLEGLDKYFGNGTKSNEQNRLEKYKENNLTKAFEERYNAHNQFIEVYYCYGAIGLLLFLIHCGFLMKLMLHNKRWYFLILYMGTLFYFLIESILVRSYGIIIYAFITTFIYTQINVNEKKTS